MVPMSYVATVVRSLAELAGNRGDHAARREHLERALAIAREYGDTWGVEKAEAALGSTR